uniref:Uncharacterized protein n=1 Tax=Bionectria ochroleuca TaxID=29856 RepID=A0A8H7NK93_BIOOC
MRRHLEHILSVCAIPVHQPHPKPSELGTAWFKPGPGVVPIALTCGDMSEHVIYTSSSFFAFMFLLEAARRLKRIHPADKYVSICWPESQQSAKGTWSGSNLQS